jgi:hypothetical protein
VIQRRLRPQPAGAVPRPGKFEELSDGALQGGFSTGQLWLTLVAEAAIPVFVVTRCATQRPQQVWASAPLSSGPECCRAGSASPPMTGVFVALMAPGRSTDGQRDLQILGVSAFVRRAAVGRFEACVPPWGTAARWRSKEVCR